MKGAMCKCSILCLLRRLVHYKTLLQASFMMMLMIRNMSSASTFRASRQHLSFRMHTLRGIGSSSSSSSSQECVIRHLGHRGSFSEMAAQSLISLLGGGRSTPRLTLKGGYSYLEELLDFGPEATVSGTPELAIIPFESSLMGPYIHIYDALLGDGLKIFAECSRVEKHCLIGGSVNTTLSSIKRVYSHPWILGNSREFSERHSFSAIEVSSTSHAVEFVAANREDTSIAAIGSSVQAETYGLHIVKENVACDENTQTRYVIVGPGSVPDNVLECSDSVRLKSALCVLIKDEPSALFKALASFALRNLNITNVVLRPLAMFSSFREALPGGGLHWDYCFYIEYDAGSEESEAALVSSLEELSGPVVKLLGKRYPSFVRQNQYRHPDWKTRSDESLSWEQLREFLSR